LASKSLDRGGFYGPYLNLSGKRPSPAAQNGP
jgi:hypothetical protein